MRLLFTSCLIAVTLLLAGCPSRNPNGLSNSNADPNSNKSVIPAPPPPDIKPKETVDPAFKACNPYFPLVPGSQTKYTLVYSSGLVANVTVVVDGDTDNGKPVYIETIRIIDKDGGVNKLETRTTKYACDGERVQIISMSSDNKAEDNETKMEAAFSGTALAMLDTPSLKPGARWSYAFTQTFRVPNRPPVSGGKSTPIEFQVVGTETVAVPAGSFKALKVLRKTTGHEINEYYARGIGLVKRESDDGTRWELKEFSGLKAAE